MLSAQGILTNFLMVSQIHQPPSPFSGFVREGPGEQCLFPALRWDEVSEVGTVQSMENLWQEEAKDKQ